MKYIDEYRDPALAKALLGRIENAAGALGRDIAIMEVCGSHTQAIGRYGIRKMLPAHIRLISGPGCPVCVTSIHDVDTAIYLAGRPGVIFATFGDMLRVPGTGGHSLQKLRAEGADIRIVASPLDSITLARENPDKHVVFMGIGFETTSPTIGAMVIRARRQGIGNVSVFSVHKVIPPAMQALIHDPAIRIDGFLCPGHVSIVIGAAAYTFLAQTGKPAVITGFEPIDVLEGILMILEQLVEQRPAVAIQYGRGVAPEGNAKARAVLEEVFTTRDAEWRGLGTIPASGLAFQDAYHDFDALRRFEVPEIRSIEVKGCACGDVLRGAIIPDQCPLFGKGCTPINPVGPCMVSGEGSCAAYYKYR